MAPFNAFLLLVIFFCLNLITLIGIAECLLGRSFLLANIPQNVAHIGVLLLGTVIAVPLYFALLYRRRYKYVLVEFESESPRQRRIRSTTAVLYLAFSLVFLFGSAMLRAKVISH